MTASTQRLNRYQSCRWVLCCSRALLSILSLSQDQDLDQDPCSSPDPGLGLCPWSSWTPGLPLLPALSPTSPDLSGLSRRARPRPRSGPGWTRVKSICLWGPHEEAWRRAGPGMQGPSHWSERLVTSQSRRSKGNRWRREGRSGGPRT